MLTNEVRKFTDDDLRSAVKLLDLTGNDSTAAIEVLKSVAHVETVVYSQVLASHEILSRLDNDFEAAQQLVIVARSFREMLGLNPSTTAGDRDTHG